MVQRPPGFVAERICGAAADRVCCGVRRRTTLPFGDERDDERQGGEQGSGSHDARPAEEHPGRAREQRAERAADEVAAHEDRVDPVGGRRTELEQRCLVAQLDALHADVDEQDTPDDRPVVVAARGEEPPGGQLQQRPEAVEAVDAQPGDVLADEGGRHGSGDAAQPEHSHHVAAGVEGLLRHLEGERGPETHERAEGERGTHGVQPQQRVLLQQREERAHERGVAAREVGLLVGQDAEDEHGADEHHARGDAVHLAPAEPLADGAADDARGEDTREQSRKDDAHVAVFVFGSRILRGEGDEELRHDRADADNERTDVQDADVGRRRRGQQGEDQQREVDEQDPPAAAQVGERNEEEQPEGVSALREEGDVVGGQGRGAHLLPDHVEQRLVVVEVGDRDPGDDGQRIEQPVRESGSRFQTYFHSDWFCPQKYAETGENPKK